MIPVPLYEKKSRRGVPEPRHAASMPLQVYRLRKAFLYPFGLRRALKSRLLRLLKLL